ncbi:MAG: homocysteine S-methyltransferase family protein [Phycisphaerae bacterium]
MTPFLERVRSGRPLVADGAMGTMLMREGVAAGQCPEALNLSQPQTLERIAAAYLAAGAEVVQTNTFGGSPLKLSAYGLDEQAEEINRNAVEAVRRAVGERAYVSGSCGPSGKILKPYGDADPEAVSASYRRQMAALVAAGVDVVCVETMIDLNEATLAVRAAKEASPTTPVMATMTFDATKRGYYTVMGVNVGKAAEGLRAAGADLVGSNCGNGIERMVEIAREFRSATDLPLIIQANAGLPQIRDGEPVYPETPEFMADKARELIALGVRVIGGCCGTTPAHIAALRAMVDAAG